MTAVNFFSKIRTKRHCLVRRIGRVTTTGNLHSTLIAFPIRPHGMVGTACQPRLLAAPGRGVDLLTSVNMSCYLVLSFAPSVSRLATHRFVGQLLGRHCRIGYLIVNCSRHFKRGHDRKFRSCMYCKGRVNVRMVHTRTCADSVRVKAAQGVPMDSSLVHGLLRRKRIRVTTHYLGCRCFLSKAIMNNCRMNEGVNFPATGLDMSSPSGLVPTSNMCTM